MRNSVDFGQLSGGLRAVLTAWTHITAMKILFLTISMPNLSGSSNMYAALIHELARNGHEVCVVAPVAASERTEIESVSEKLRLLKVKSLPLFGVNLVRKGIANVLLPFIYQRAIDRYLKGEKFDLIITPTPPITLANVVARMKKRSRAKTYLILRDIFPQNAVDLGFMKKWWPLYWHFRRQEKKLYRVCDKIGCMSQGNIDYIRKHDPEVPAEKLHILENFQTVEPLVPATEDLKAKYGVGGKFVVIFGGNMGVPQKLENVLALAKACEADYPDVVFLLVGKGVQQARIRKMIDEMNLSNTILKDFIPYQDYQKLVAQCDIGLISLNERFTIPNIPSKTLSYFNLKIPVLASLDAATDYGKILEDINAGLWSIAGDVPALKANFDKLYRDPERRKQMGENGRRYLETHMSDKVAYRVLMDALGK